MKITETIKRECCQYQDLLKYNGTQIGPDAYGNRSPFKFCKHCGQLWEETSRMDAAGGTECYLRKVVSPTYILED